MIYNGTLRETLARTLHLPEESDPARPGVHVKAVAADIIPYRIELDVDGELITTNPGTWARILPIIEQQIDWLREQNDPEAAAAGEALAPLPRERGGQ